MFSSLPGNVNKGVSSFLTVELVALTLLRLSLKALHKESLSPSSAAAALPKMDVEVEPNEKPVRLKRGK